VFGRIFTPRRERCAFRDDLSADNIDSNDERAAGDGAMSDNWVGPGWWMASDGKWYPPRTASTIADSSDEAPTRWSRRAPDGEAVDGPTAMSATESLAQRAAIRSERAEMMAPAEPVSIKRIDDPDFEESELEVVAPALDVVEDLHLPQEIDLDTAIDLRASAEAEREEFGITTHEFVTTLNSSSTEPPVTREISASGFASLSSIRSMEVAPKTVSMTPLEAEPEAGDHEPVSESPTEQTDATDGAIEHVEDTVEDAEDVENTAVEQAPGLIASPGGRSAEMVPLQHAVLQEVAPQTPETQKSSGFVLLALATVLALVSGVLGALWLRERSVAEDLRVELDEAQVVEEVAVDTDVDDLNDEIRTLQLQNEELQTKLNDASALVLELPAGRLTEIVVPFTPIFADEENDRLIAMSEQGEYVVWADGADGAITDSGLLGGTPTGLFAAARKAWISTDAARIEIVSLTNEEGLPAVEFGPTEFLAAEERAYWTYDTTSGDVVRLRKGDGDITAAVSVPSRVVDLTIGAGSVWALGEDGRVYRINTADFTVQGIDAGTDLISVTAGPDALWTLSAADGSLRRVDAVSGEVLVTVPVGRDPIDATFAGSSVWVALRSGTSLIEVDTRTSAVISRTALPGVPTALHQGDSGVFVTMEGDVPLVRVASLLQVPSEAEDAAEDSTDAG
jgi:hypothetical protein